MSYLPPLLDAIPVVVLDGGSSGCVRKTGSLAGVGVAVFEDGVLLAAVALSPLLLFLSFDSSFGGSGGGGGEWDLAGSFGGVFSRFSPPSLLTLACDLALEIGFAFCISRCTTSSATLGEGGDGGGGGAVALSSLTILFSTGSYRCSLRNEREEKRGV